jgi:hypothetical protein
MGARGVRGHHVPALKGVPDDDWQKAAEVIYEFVMLDPDFVPAHEILRERAAEVTRRIDVMRYGIQEGIKAYEVPGTAKVIENIRRKASGSSDE